MPHLSIPYYSSGTYSNTEFPDERTLHLTRGLDAPSLTCLGSDPSGQILFLVPDPEGDHLSYEEYMERRWALETRNHLEYL